MGRCLCEGKEGGQGGKGWRAGEGERLSGYVRVIGEL